jgi:hypothetical protein
MSWPETSNSFNDPSYAEIHVGKNKNPNMETNFKNAYYHLKNQPFQMEVAMNIQ